MPNVTISIPEDLKNEMDALTEVNWSEICRGAISLYITQRKNPIPQIELSIYNYRMDAHDFETGYPTLTLDLRIFNKMNTEILVDRVLCSLTFRGRDRIFPIGNACDLHRKWILANGVGGATIRLVLLKEKLIELKDNFQSTFNCEIRCSVIVENFWNEFTGEVSTKIPIDLWNETVTEALKIPLGT
jgi:hypothetical protein